MLTTYLIPDNLHSLSDTAVASIQSECQTVLLYSTEFDNELSMWKVHASSLIVMIK